MCLGLEVSNYVLRMVQARLSLINVFQVVFSLDRFCWINEIENLDEK